MKSLKRFSLKVLALTLSMVLMFGTVPLYANDDINDEPSVELLYDTAWVPDPPEVIQEHLLTPAEIAEITEIKPTAALPSSVDLSYSFPTPGRQAHGDCTAWSTVYALKTHQEWRMRGWSLDDERHIFSPAYVYNQLRARPSGAGEATALDLMRDEGVCSLASFPYNDQDYTAQPTPEQRAEAALYKGTEWGTIQGVNAIKTWLASGRGVVAGYANPGGGGHSICLVGYDDSKVAFGSTGAFKYIDSQGPNWAEGGYSWIPYDHLSVRGDIGAHGESIGYVMIDDPYYFAPTITSPLTYSASVGNLFSFGFTATGKQPITWSVVEGSLPLGLTHFSGMLAASGTYSLTVKAENSVGSDTKAISLTVTGIDPTNVAIVPKPANVTAGQRIQLTTTVLPENAPYKTVTWTSSDTSIATVNDLGEVRGVIAGQATITTTTGNGLTDTCVVTVDPPQVTVSPSSLSLSVGSFQSLTAAVLPEFRRVTWSSSDTSIATVSSGGLVSAVSPGQVTITARTADGGSGTCVATVTEIMPERVFISPAPISPILGRSTQLTAQISPANASNKTVTWTSNDPSVATVDNTGNVTAVSIGQTSVTATAVNGISDTITVTVRRPDPTGVTISPKPVSLTLGAKTQLTASVLPETADQAVTWSSYDSSVASVDAFGNVTALRVGQTTIQVQTTNGQRSDSCVVTVSPSQPQPSIAVATTGLTNLKVGQAVNATVTYTASSATFASTITPSHFTVGNLPAGLSAQAAQRASDTRVTITITGTPTTHNANTITLTRSTSIPASNLTGVTSAIAPTGTITASAVAKGNGGALSGAPAEQSKTSNSVTVGALTNTGGTGQSVEYAISTSSTPTPSTGWQNSTTFSGLSPGIYYVHARTAESLNYNAGTARASAAITVVNPAIVVSATGLTNLKVGQAVNASVIYTLSGATYASPITASHFSVGNLPAGLSAGAATRGANGTAVTVPITGTPTTHTTNAVTLTRSTSIPASNITGAISAITPSGTITASAVAKGDGGAISGLPTQQSKTSNSVTVGALTNVGGTGQSVQYAISTSSTSTPSTGWQNSTTFSALSPGTYYVHARTAESANYNAGTARVSAVIYVVNPAITVTTTGLTNLKVGQGVNASVVYTLTGATYAPAINSSHFSVGNLPAGLSAGEAARGANNTTVTIPITGRPTTHATSAVTLTRSTSIAASNVTGATSAITPTGSITASAVVKGDGSLLTAVPSVQSKTASTITVKPLFLTTATGQSIEYAINTSATTTPSSGWKTDTTFSGLAEGTVYYVHARSAANTNYNAGRVLVSTGIETDFVGLVFTPNNRFATANVGAGANGRVPITVRNTANTAINVTVQGTQGSSIAADPVLFNSAGAQIAFHNFYNFNFGYNVTLNAGAMWRGFVGTGGDVARSYTVETTWSAMAVSTTGLSHLKVGQAVSGASMVYTLASGTFVQTITPSHFTAGNLPAGLTAGAAERTNNTTVTIPITGTPTTHSTLTSTPTRAFSIPAANVTDATSSIVPTGVPGASAVAKGDGSPLNNVPTVQNTTANSITVNTLTTTLATGQTVQYAISTSGTVTPVSGWQNGTTFSNLLAGTYYVYARSAENANYYAGPVRVSGAITVGGGPALPAIAVSATGLTNLKVGQAVSGASVVYTLTNGTYATSITPSHFTVTGLPVGLTAGTAQRTSNTVVTIPITGTPTTYNASTTTLTFASSIPVANVTGATSAIVPTGTPTASAIARGDGGAVSGAPTEQSKTSNSITVGAVTNIGGTGQSVEYAISTSATTTPTSGWQTSTTFSGLTQGTTYYVYARTEANTNYNAGSSRVSAAITLVSPAILVSATGLTNLKVGQTVSGASVVYTLTNGTYPSSITTSQFNIGNLPPGLTQGTVTRTSATIVTVAINGTPSTYSASTRAITFSSNISVVNSSGITVGITPSGTPTASAIARGDGGAVSGAPTEQSKTSNSITVGAVTNIGGTGQSVEYAISTSATTTPTSGWQASTTFSGLTQGTTYYVYARTAANTNYNAGSARVSAAILLEVLPTGVTISPKPLTITEGQSRQLSATVLPANAANKTVSWSSSNASVASVNALGNLTAHRAGQATVTARTVNGITDTCLVTVEAAPVNSYTVTFNVVNGTWDGTKSDPIVYTVKHGDMLPTIPTGMWGNYPEYDQSEGSWSSLVPIAGTPVTKNMEFIYVFDRNQYEVYYYVINGTWADSTSKSIIYTVKHGDVLPPIPAGMRGNFPDYDQNIGSWSSHVPIAGTQVTKQLEFIYVFSHNQYTLSLTRSGSTEAFTFSSQQVGYTDPQSITLTLSNPANRAISSLFLTVGGANSGSFNVVPGANLSSIEPGATRTITVSPRTGLSAGTYTADIAVEGNYATSNTIKVSFTVLPNTGPKPYSIALDTTALAFAEVDPGYRAPTARTIRVTNDGTMATGALTVSLSGTNATSFTLSRASIASIAVRGSATFTVVPRTGLAAGTHTATVTVRGANGIEASFPVSFKVNESRYSIALDATEVSFPAVDPGYRAPTARTIRATNTGNQPTGALTVSLSGTNATSFTLSRTSLTSIATGGSATFTVVPRTGLSAGVYLATVTVRGANSIERSFTVRLEVRPGIYQVSLDATAISFPAAGPGYRAPSAQTIRVYNRGNQPTGVLALNISGANASSFTISRASLASIAVGGSASFTVVPRTGLSAGIHEATVNVRGANGIERSFTVKFVVNAAIYKITVDTIFSSTSINFPSAGIGYRAQSAQTVHVTNLGNMPTGALTIALSGANASSFTISRTSLASIAAERSVTFTIVPRTGLAAGAYEATLTVRGANGIEQSLPVTFVVNPAIYSVALYGTPVDFPSAALGYRAQSARTVSVHNNGNQATGALTLSLSGTNAASFTLSRTSLTSIAVGGNATFTVVPRTGLAAGSYEALVMVRGTNGISESFTVSFTVR